MGVRALFLIAVGVAGASAANLRVGVATRVITPELKPGRPVYIAGYGNNRVATGVHDPLYARCMAFDTGQRPLVICGVDLIGVFWDDVEKIRAQVPDAQVVVAALHDHEGPDTMGLWGPAEGRTGIDEQYMQMMIRRTAEAARAAIADLRPASVRLANVRSPELDSFINDTRPPDVHDSIVVALEAIDNRGQPIGTLLNWANHPEALGSRNTLITADYSAGVCRRLEEQLGGTAVFINGAVGGMQSPGGAKIVDRATGRLFTEDTFERADYIGTRVAELAVDVLAKARETTFDAIVFREKLAAIPMTNPAFQAGMRAGVFAGRKQPTAAGEAQTPVGFLRLSNKGKPLLEVALIPGELYPELSVGGISRYPGADFPDAPAEPPIKPMMSAPFRMLFGLANDENGYIIPKAEWDEHAPWLENAPRPWYGEVNSLGPDAAPIIVQTLAQLVSAR